jgi:hypothetical protein
MTSVTSPERAGYVECEFDCGSSHLPNISVYEPDAPAAIGISDRHGNPLIRLRPMMGFIEFNGRSPLV